MRGLWMRRSCSVSEICVKWSKIFEKNVCCCCFEGVYSSFYQIIQLVVSYFSLAIVQSKRKGGRFLLVHCENNAVSVSPQSVDFVLKKGDLYVLRYRY